MRRFAGIVSRMTEHTIIRAFSGSLADAEGLLAVEKETFNEAPYSAEQVQTMLADGPQHGWLAVSEGQVVGFAVAFVTAGLTTPCWEIDLLAVHPDWSGRGLGTRLIRTASAHGVEAAKRARGLVASDNPASVRAFTRAGFHASEKAYKLLIFGTKDTVARPWTALGVTVTETADPAEAEGWLPEALSDAQKAQGLTLLLAEQNGQPAGYAELIEIETLLYRGIWIESLTASSQMARSALVNAAVEQAIAAGLDEVGSVVPRHDRLLQETLLAAQFRSLGDFYWLSARLPLPGLAIAPHPGDDHA